MTATPPTPAHAAPTWQQKALSKLKAIVAGFGTALFGELIVVITDSSFQGQVSHLVPPAYAFLVPILFGVFVGALTHSVPNTPLPAETAD